MVLVYHRPTNPPAPVMRTLVTLPHLQRDSLACQALARISVPAPLVPDAGDLTIFDDGVVKVFAGVRAPPLELVAVFHGHLPGLLLPGHRQRLDRPVTKAQQ